MNSTNQAASSDHPLKSSNNSTETKRAEETRRTELAMLGIWIEKYPEQAREKLRRLTLKINREK